MHINTERSYADNFAYNKLTQKEFAIWESCRSAHRFLAYRGKELVIYQLLFDTPRILKTLTCTAVQLSFDAGFSTTWIDHEEAVYTIEHAPVMVHDSVFLWHVFDSQVQFLPYNGKFNAKLPLAYRSKLNPIGKEEGVIYILERSVFDNMFGKQ